MTQEMGEVPEPLGIFQTKNLRARPDSPVLAFFAENALLHEADARLGAAASRCFSSSVPSLAWHLTLSGAIWPAWLIDRGLKVYHLPYFQPNVVRSFSHPSGGILTPCELPTIRRRKLMESRKTLTTDSGAPVTDNHRLAAKTSLNVR